MKHIQLEELCERIRREKLAVFAHSERLTPGGVFAVMPAAVPRDRLDSAPGGEAYLAKALEKRPFAVICSPKHAALVKELLPGEAGPLLAVTDSPRAALGRAAAAMYGTDRACPVLVGITGTNGKTTESYLLECLFAAKGRKVGVIGTVDYRWPGHSEPASLTSPDCLSLHRLLARMRDDGVDLVFMEVSSHALDQERVAGLNFSAALLTNITQDHLDYHRDMEDYFAAKIRLFRDPDEGGVPLAGKKAALNADDPFCRRLLERDPQALAYGLLEAPPVHSRHLLGTVMSIGPKGLRLSMRFGGRNWELESPLVGEFNAMNLLGAQALGLALGLEPADFAVLSSFSGVPGRLERVFSPGGLNAFVDYAHTPDALDNALRALRAAGFARIITVFGCGGNRDRGKRPLMGEAAARGSDVAVLTSDNPRHEDPDAIIADVLPGLARCHKVIVEPDRRQAIREAVTLLGPDDALLVAGKGHETYQQIGDVKTPFSDQQVLRELFQCA